MMMETRQIAGKVAMAEDVAVVKGADNNRAKSLNTDVCGDRRNIANPAPATKNRKPGLVPGFFVSTIC